MLIIISHIIVYLSVLSQVTAQASSDPVTEFVVTLTRLDDQGNKVGGTAVTILPEWLLTSFQCVGDFPLNKYTVTATLDSGNPLTKSLVDPMYCNEPHEDKPSVCLLKMKHPFPANSKTVPIATRTDMLWHSECFIYASDQSMKFIKYPVKILKRNCPEALGQIRGVLVCAKPSAAICGLPCGSALVCDNRLLGIRYDTVKCADRFVFASLLHADRHVLEALQKEKAGIIQPRANTKIFANVSRGSFSCLLLDAKFFWISVQFLSVFLSLVR